MKINDQARKDLLKEVEGMTDEQINRKPSENEWSVKQVLEHLYLMEGAITKMVSEGLESDEVSEVPDLPIERTVDRSVKVAAPDFAAPSDSFASLQELKERLNVTHESLRSLAEHADEEKLRSRSFPHPVFNQMSLAQWIPFTAYHEMRHTDQIREVKSKL